MDDTENKLPDILKEQVPQKTLLPADQPVQVPMYRRDLFPTNLVISAEDLKEFAELISEVNERSKELEYQQLDLSTWESSQHAKERINEVIPVEYNYKSQNGDYVQGVGIPNTADRNFPDELMTIFFSNSTFTKRAINIQPINSVDVFLSFEKPSLKIDFQSLPSNPTDNRSVINIEGRNEAWVISTAQKIDDFFKKRKTTRPIIHGSGAYDYIIYLVFLPAVMWFFYRYATPASRWLEQQTILLNVTLGIYGLLLSLLFARFLFQYARWLFPPMEYYKKRRIGAFIHRSIATFVLAGLGVSAAYDFVKWMIMPLNS